jgi:protein-S-isoprenylcysteine O-methyltransferase Ste14
LPKQFTFLKNAGEYAVVKIGIFILLSFLLFVFTVVRRPYRHRFPRFFAFESVIAIVLLNAKSWFINPFSFRQVVSWFFLAASLGLALHGFRLLRIAGVPEDDIEETTQLVTIGVYRYIRHPLYCSLILGGVGAFLKEPTYFGLILFLILTGFVFLTCKFEEDENLNRFGEQYLTYMETTKMFIPF